MNVYWRNCKVIYYMFKIVLKDCWYLLFYYAVSFNLGHDEFLKFIFIVLTILATAMVLVDFYTVFGILYLLYVFIKFHIMIYKQAINEIKKLKSHLQNKYHPVGDDTALFCLICMSKERCILNLPCKHISMCELCSKTITQTRRDCPICNQRIRNNVRVYFS